MTRPARSPLGPKPILPREFEAPRAFEPPRAPRPFLFTESPPSIRPSVEITIGAVSPSVIVTPGLARVIGHERPPQEPEDPPLAGVCAGPKTPPPTLQGGERAPLPTGETT